MTAAALRAATAEMPSIGEIWADDGSLGLGFIHAPKVEHFVVASYRSIPPTVSYNGPSRPGSILPAILARCEIGKPIACHMTGAPSPNHQNRPFWNPADFLNGRAFKTVHELIDAVAEAGLPVVTTTNCGGTYRRVR